MTLVAHMAPRTSQPEGLRNSVKSTAQKPCLISIQVDNTRNVLQGLGYRSASLRYHKVTKLFRLLCFR